MFSRSLASNLKTNSSFLSQFSLQKVGFSSRGINKQTAVISQTNLHKTPSVLQLFHIPGKYVCLQREADLQVENTYLSIQQLHVADLQRLPQEQLFLF